MSHDLEARNSRSLEFSVVFRWQSAIEGIASGEYAATVDCNANTITIADANTDA